MSSNHTRVSNSEWQALQERIASTEAYVISREAEAARIASLIETRQREINAIHQANSAAIQRSVDSLAAMFNQNVNMLRSGVDEQLRSRAGAFGAELQGMRDQLSGTSARLTELDGKIDALATTYNDIFNEYIKQEQAEGLRAERMLNEVDRLMELVDALDPQRFSPVEYARLVSLREATRANLNAGDAQAAMAVSQNGILQSTRLLARLQLLNEQYNTRLDAVRARALDTQRRIEELSSSDGVLSTAVNGEELEFDYDVSFWSHGAFDTIVSDFQRQQAMLDSKLTPEQLNQVAANLSVLDENLSVCDANARSERISAYIAADAAERLHNGLTENSGWSLQNSGFADDDEREPFNMTYTDSVGNTVSVVIAPESPDSPGIFMEVFSENEDRAEKTKDSIHAMLQRDGIEIGEREQRNDCHLNPDPETFAANAVAEAQATLRRRRNQL